jgi:IS5 family transposase
MLRTYFPQQWFNLSDPQAEDAIYDSESMRRCTRVELGDQIVPDDSTILRFRHLLERHGLTKAIFDAVAGLLEERGRWLRSGTIVAATIIAGVHRSCATKNPCLIALRARRAFPSIVRGWSSARRYTDWLRFGVASGLAEGGERRWERC